MPDFDFNWTSLDYIYYPVSGIMWLWYKLFGFLLGQGYDVTPVNPLLSGHAIHDRIVVANLAEAAPLDMVDIFRASANAGAAVDDAIRLGAVWAGASAAGGAATGGEAVPGRDGLGAGLTGARPIGSGAGVGATSTGAVGPADSGEGPATGASASGRETGRGTSPPGSLTGVTGTGSGLR